MKYCSLNISNGIQEVCNFISRRFQFHDHKLCSCSWTIRLIQVSFTQCKTFWWTSEIGFAPPRIQLLISGQSVSPNLDNCYVKGREALISFSLHMKIHVFEITLDVVREALHLPIHTKYDAPPSDEVIREFFAQIGYAGEMERFEQVGKAKP